MWYPGLFYDNNSRQPVQPLSEEVAGDVGVSCQNSSVVSDKRDLKENSKLESGGTAHFTPVVYYEMSQQIR